MASFCLDHPVAAFYHSCLRSSIKNLIKSWCWAVARTALEPSNSLWNTAMNSNKDIVKHHLNLSGKGELNILSFWHKFSIRISFPWSYLPIFAGHFLIKLQNYEVINHEDAFDGFGCSYLSFRKRKAEKGICWYHREWMRDVCPIVFYLHCQWDNVFWSGGDWQFSVSLLLSNHNRFIFLFYELCNKGFIGFRMT